jgi:GT2 family glycosyltransferase
MIKTALVILNWNGLGYLKQFLGTVCKHTDNDSIIYVADNGSTDGSSDWVSENFSNVKLIRLDKNFGFAGGYNRALEQLDAEYYVLINSDIETTDGWLRPLIRYMESNPDVASCQPKIMSYVKRDHFEYAGAAGGFIDKYGYPFCRGRIFNITEKDRGQYNTVTDILWSSGACMLVRAEAWKKCGGLDDDFFAHMEEIDLCWRFNNAGYRVTCIPESVVYHVGGGALPYNSPFKTYLNFRNNLFLLYKNLPDNNFRRIIFIRKILDGLAALLFISKGDFGAVRSIWNAHIDYYKSLQVLKVKRKMVKPINTSMESGKQILNKSIVFEFYMKGRKTFSSLKLGNLVK